MILREAKPPRIGRTCEQIHELDEMCSMVIMFVGDLGVLCM